MTSTTGSLGLYNASPNDLGRLYPYFTSGDISSKRVLVFIGGLFNGPGGVPYTTVLGDELAKRGWRLVQPHWSSAFDGFGTGSLDRDVSELGELIKHLKAGGAETVALMGHSTGSQNTIHYLLSQNQEDPQRAIVGGIMQAPVSDREHFQQDPGTATWTAALPEAVRLVESGKGEQLLDGGSDKTFGLRMTAYRLWSLLSPKGDDDYFSYDLPSVDDGSKHFGRPLSTTFGRLPSPALALFSDIDEYATTVTKNGSSGIDAHLARWTEANAAGLKSGEAKGKLTTKRIAGANHAVEDEAVQPVLAGVVASWLEENFGK